MKDLKEYLLSLHERFSNASKETAEKMKPLVERLDAIEQSDGEFTLDDLILILNILDEDTLLNNYFVWLNEAHESKQVLDGVADTGIGVQSRYSYYDTTMLEVIQGILQGFGAQLIDLIVMSQWGEKNASEEWTIRTPSVSRLMNEGFEVSISFAKMDGDADDLYPTVLIELENFYVDL